MLINQFLIEQPSGGQRVTVVDIREAYELELLAQLVRYGLNNRSYKSPSLAAGLLLGMPSKHHSLWNTTGHLAR